MTKSKGAAPLRLVAGFAAAVLFSAGLPAAPAAETILVGGTGSGSRLLQALAHEYAKAAPNPAIRVVDPPMGSGAAIKAVREGKLHLALSPRPLEGDEGGGEVVAFEFARTPLVFASRDDFQGGGFNLEQLEDVYTGRRMWWDNGIPIRLILRSRVASDTRAIRAMSPGMDKAVSQSFERKGMVVAASDLEALQMIERTPGSLGPTTLGLIRLQDSRARVLQVAGRAPSAGALADGSYPWFKGLYLVIPRRPPPDVQAFLDFLVSPQAGTFMRRIEHLPVTDGK
jgi:phosphate transport system substrate-binding protein